MDGIRTRAGATAAAAAAAAAARTVGSYQCGQQSPLLNEPQALRRQQPETRTNNGGAILVTISTTTAAAAIAAEIATIAIDKICECIVKKLFLLSLSPVVGSLTYTSTAYFAKKNVTEAAMVNFNVEATKVAASPQLQLHTQETCAFLGINGYNTSNLGNLPPLEPTKSGVIKTDLNYVLLSLL